MVRLMADHPPLRFYPPTPVGYENHETNRRFVVRREAVDLLNAIANEEERLSSIDRECRSQVRDKDLRKEFAADAAGRASRAVLLRKIARHLELNKEDMSNV